MIVQPGLQKDIVHKKYLIGAHPIIQFFMDKLKIDEIIGSYVRQDKRMKLSVEKTLCIMIHNYLSSPLPMYELEDWLSPLDEEKIGLQPGDTAFLNDDRAGKALESLYHGRHKDIFFHLSLRAIKLFELDCRQIHQDTTTITFSGKYAGWSAQQLLTHGVNKDHRPDLKQLVLGISVTADGSIPLVHEIYDGNQTDDRLHPANHARLRKLLKRSDFIYVADCKLATEDNLSKIAACDGLFVSVMPRSWKEDKVFRERVRKGLISWTHLLSKPNNRKPKSKRDHYYLAEGQHVTSKGYRLLWILSTQKAAQDAETRQRNLEESMASLRELQTRINKYNLKTSKDIDDKVTAILKQHKCSSLILYKIRRETEKITLHKKPGRPRSTDIGSSVEKKYFKLSFDLNDVCIREEALTDGVFPLITNVKSKTPKEILQIYKYQPFLEKRHSQLKTYQEVAPAFLKKSERVIAYLHVNVMALMVATLLERHLRLAMKRSGIESLQLYPEGKPCKYPTTFDIVRLFKGIERYEVVQGDSVQLFPAQLNSTQKQVLQLMGVPISLYL